MLSLKAQIDELGKADCRDQHVKSRPVTPTRFWQTTVEPYRRSARCVPRLDELKGAVLDLRGRSIQYNILQREVDTNRSLYDALLQRYKEIGVAGGVGTAPVSIVDRADAPTSPYGQIYS